MWSRWFTPCSIYSPPDFAWKVQYVSLDWFMEQNKAHNTPAMRVSLSLFDFRTTLLLIVREGWEKMPMMPTGLQRIGVPLPQVDKRSWNCP